VVDHAISVSISNDVIPGVRVTAGAP